MAKAVTRKRIAAWIISASLLFSGIPYTGTIGTASAKTKMKTYTIRVGKTKKLSIKVKGKAVTFSISPKNVDMEDTWYAWLPDEDSSAKVSQTDTIAECTYFGYLQMGGQVKTSESDGTQKLHVFNVDPVTLEEEITFTGPGETYRTGEEPEEVVITLDSIILNETELTLQKDETFQLELKGAEASWVTWKVDSTPADAVTVSDTGLVTAKEEGTATVTALYDGKQYKCIVTVEGKKDYVDITGYYEGSYTLTDPDSTFDGEKWFTLKVRVDGLYYFLDFDSSYGGQPYYAEFSDEKDGVLTYEGANATIVVGNGKCTVKLRSDSGVYLIATGERVRS